MYYDELYHHGVKGQRWGIRRFQNKDGSLTRLGAARLSKNDKRYDSKTGKLRDEIGTSRELHKQVAVDYAFAQKGLNSARNATNGVSDFLRNVRQNANHRKAQKLNVSEMSDQDIRAYVNRYRLEQDLKRVQEDQLNSGRHTVEEYLEYAGAAVGIAASIAGIAMTIHQLQQ